MHKIYFIFNKKIKYIWNTDSITNIIEYILRVISLLPEFSWQIYMVRFYIVFSFVLFTIFYLLYLSYNYSRKRVVLSGSMQFLRIILKSFMTISYLPILQTFVLNLNCVWQGENYVHFEFREVVCWQQMHILQSVLGVLMSIIFTVLVVILNLIFFESKTIAHDYTSR